MAGAARPIIRAILESSFAQMKFPLTQAEACGYQDKISFENWCNTKLQSKNNL
jgi:hypothetical protein